ncbi:phospholipase [Flavobacteriaceae bacterium Ap0902]|nr:phospholipase [Flavobacteriaceae bacterium Ap0902]
MINTDLSLKYLYKPAKEGTENPRLLLLMHGYGSNEQDLFSFATELPDDFFIVSVRAPRALSFGGFAWYDINFQDAQKFNDTTQATASIRIIRNFISEVIAKFNLNQEEVWLCGFSQGAILSYAMVLQNPQNIKRVMCLSGYPAQDIIGENISENFDGLAFFISHGTEDAVIPIDWARKGDELLSQFNIPHTYKEYRSGHGLVPQNFYDLLSWIKSHH